MTEAAWERAHREAMAAGASHYRDPATGYRVFTELGLRERGKCCGCGCRHCPWAHEAIEMSQRAERIVRPAMLHGDLPAGPLKVVFWSGGKDSFLTLRQLLRDGADAHQVLLLTSFGLPRRVVAHQEVPIAAVVEQAKALQLPLLGVPLAPKADYLSTMSAALRQIAADASLEALVFGDLHLEHIRGWRDEAIGPLASKLGARLDYPLWQRDYDALLQDFVASGARARVCAAPDAAAIAPVRVGDDFGEALLARLPETIDAFGESGEFHTYVEPASLGPARDWV